MRRSLSASTLLGLALSTVGCDKPVLSEVVKPRLGEIGAGTGFVDGAVVEDDLDAGLDDAGSGEISELVEPDPDTTTFSKAALLKAAADCALKQVEALHARTQVLLVAAERWAGDRSEQNAADARAAYRAALSTLQRGKALEFGAAARSSSIGGQNLGDKLYTPFPSVDRCAIDRQLAFGTFTAKDIAGAPARQRGLSAFEYLAYYVGPDNACAAGVDINTDGSWAALGGEERSQRRADFAAALAADALATSEQILSGWRNGGDFYAQITGPGGTLFRNEQSALNTISNAMFYLEIDVKDLKLGRVLNKTGTVCGATTCADALEAPLSGLSAQNIRDNLVGFRRVFQGCGTDNRGLGFDDWLEAVGASETSLLMLAALTEADAKLSAVPSLERALAEDRASVSAMYDAVKQVTDRLKGELTTVLDLEPPAGLEGDND